MKKFFMFLIINYVIIHIAAFSQLANNIVNTVWGGSENFYLENVFFCNQIIIIVKLRVKIIQDTMLFREDILRIDI